MTARPSTSLNSLISVHFWLFFLRETREKGKEENTDKTVLSSVGQGKEGREQRLDLSTWLSLSSSSIRREQGSRRYSPTTLSQSPTSTPPTSPASPVCISFISSYQCLHRPYQLTNHQAISNYIRQIHLQHTYTCSATFSSTPIHITYRISGSAIGAYLKLIDLSLPFYKVNRCLRLFLPSSLIQTIPSKSQNSPSLFAFRSRSHFPCSCAVEETEVWN